MLKFSSILFLIAAVNFGNGGILRPSTSQTIQNEIPAKTDLAIWGQHVMDFLNLMDINEVVQVVMAYIQDPEVQGFIQFMMSPEMKEIVMDFESIEEFKEAVEYLESKGYQARFIINMVNSLLKLPPFEESKIQLKQDMGMIGFIKDIMGIIPVEEMKELFESKLNNSPEVAELFETVTSEEFVDIVKRLLVNPKFVKIQEKLEISGFGIEYVCVIAQGIFGDEYQGINCK